MNLLELRNSLRRHVGNPTVTDIPDVNLDGLLNEANRFIMDTYPFHASRSLWVFDTVAGTKRYQLPADLSTLMLVGNRTRRYRIRKKDMQNQFRAENQIVTHTGPPVYYSRALDWIQFDPIPDAVYSIALMYKNTVADMVHDTDVSPIPLVWHPGIVRYARYLFYDEKQDFGRAQYAYASWTLWVGNKPSELQEELLHDSETGAELPFLRRGNNDLGPEDQDVW